MFPGIQTGEFIQLALIRCHAGIALSPFGSISSLYQTILDPLTKCGYTEPPWTHLRLECQSVNNLPGRDPSLIPMWKVGVIVLFL